MPISLIRCSAVQTQTGEEHCEVTEECKQLLQLLIAVVLRVKQVAYPIELQYPAREK
jgi:hypothetical protein